MRTAILLLLLYVSTAVAEQPQDTDYWVWKTPTILDLPARGEALRDFCRSQQINEVYQSFSQASSFPARARSDTK